MGDCLGPLVSTWLSYIIGPKQISNTSRHRMKSIKQCTHCFLNNHFPLKDLINTCRIQAQPHLQAYENTDH